MKILKIVLLIVAWLLLTITLQANSINYSNNFALNTLFKQDVSQQIKYPVEAKRNKAEGRVAVEFIVNEDGRIKVTEINGHPEFLNSVKEQLESIYTKPYKYTVGNKMILKFKFEIIN